MEFWKEFLKIEQLVTHNLRVGSKEEQVQALECINIVGTRTGYPLLFQVGYGIRNGKKLDERTNTLELIISPNWNRTKIHLVNKLYKTGLLSNLPSYWCLIKYQVFSPTFVHSLDVGGIKPEHFQYWAQLNFEGKKVFLSILLFIDDEIAKTTLVKSKTKTENDVGWVLNKNLPEGRAPLIFLNAAIGEYNMIQRIKTIEFLPASERPEMSRCDISNLHDEFEKIDKHDYSGNPVTTCNRCGHFSYQVNNSPCEKCKKNSYCDEVCKNADSENHKFICKE
jgi:hypothetical protein